MIRSLWTAESKVDGGQREPRTWWTQGEHSHVGRPSELSGDENHGGLGDSVRDDNLLDLVAKGLLDGRAKVLELLGLLLSGSLLLVGLLELESLLGDTDELETLELLELGDGVLVDGVDEKEDLEALLL